jgi:NAD(P)-dependent dehydrogenase (short-subunit alcohol dehydrogenase family)
VKQVVEEINQLEGGGSASGAICDVTDSTSISKLVADLDRLDILVANAGTTGTPGEVQDLNDADWDEVLNTNLRSVFLLAKAAFPLLCKNGGKIITVSSITSIFGSVGMLYCLITDTR